MGSWRWPPTSSFEVKERAELYLYYPSGPSWPVQRWTLPFTFYKWHSTLLTVRHTVLSVGITCLNFKHFCIVIREYLCCRTTPAMPILITLTGCYCNTNSVIPVSPEPNLMSSFQSTKERVVCRGSLSVRPPVQGTFIKLASGPFVKFNLQLITDLRINLLMALRKLDFITRQHDRRYESSAACNKCRNKVREIEGYVVSTPHRVLLTFSRLMTYIYIYIYMSYRTANLQMLHFLYLFNKYTYWIF